MSRIQQSEAGTELITVTVEPHCVRARAAFVEPPTHMATGSCRAISLASLAMSAWILVRRLPQMVVLDDREAVILPRFGDKKADKDAAAIVGELYPGREVVQVPADTLGEGGGGIHCATQQMPKRN